VSNTMTRDEVVDRLGAKDWDEVERHFKGATLSDIIRTVYTLYPNEKSNSALVAAICRLLRK